VRFDVYVGRPVAQGLRDDELHDLDDRRFVVRGGHLDPAGVLADHVAGLEHLEPRVDPGQRPEAVADGSEDVGRRRDP
jgi:hypothetical protein